MRKICILLCLSLFTSLIHAAVMKVDLPAHSSSQQINTTDSSVHHCDDNVSKPSDSTPNHTCHASDLQCCLGLILAPSLELQLNTNLTETLTSKTTPLVPKTMVNLIYRPPKAQALFYLNTMDL